MHKCELPANNGKITLHEVVFLEEITSHEVKFRIAG